MVANTDVIVVSDIRIAASFYSWAAMQHIGIEECNVMIKNKVVETVMNNLREKLENVYQTQLTAHQSRFTFPGIALSGLSLNLYQHFPICVEDSPDFADPQRNKQLCSFWL